MKNNKNGYCTALSSSTELDTAKRLIDEFCWDEYDEAADFTDLRNIGLGYTSTEDEMHDVEIIADLVAFEVLKFVDRVLVVTEHYKSLDDMIEKQLSCLDFAQLIYDIDDEIFEMFDGPEGVGEEFAKMTDDDKQTHINAVETMFDLGDCNHLTHADIALYNTIIRERAINSVR